MTNHYMQGKDVVLPHLIVWEAGRNLCFLLKYPLSVHFSAITDKYPKTENKQNPPPSLQRRCSAPNLVPDDPYRCSFFTIIITSHMFLLCLLAYKRSNLTDLLDQTFQYYLHNWSYYYSASVEIAPLAGWPQLQNADSSEWHATSPPSIPDVLPQVQLLSCLNGQKCLINPLYV